MTKNENGRMIDSLSYGQHHHLSFEPVAKQQLAQYALSYLISYSYYI